MGKSSTADPDEAAEVMRRKPPPNVADAAAQAYGIPAHRLRDCETNQADNWGSKADRSEELQSSPAAEPLIVSGGNTRPSSNVDSCSEIETPASMAVGAYVQSMLSLLATVANTSAAPKRQRCAPGVTPPKSKSLPLTRTSVPPVRGPLASELLTRTTLASLEFELEAEVDTAEIAGVGSDTKLTDGLTLETMENVCPLRDTRTAWLECGSGGLKHSMVRIWLL
eukprot:4585828-Prymnesium_polylepis.1